MDATGNQAFNAPAIFTSGVSVNRGVFHTTAEVTATDTVTWGANIFVSPNDVGKTADLLFAIGVEAPSELEPLSYSGNEDTIYSAIDSTKTTFLVNLYVPRDGWSGELAKMTARPFKENVVLGKNISVELWTGNVTEWTILPKARIYTFVGYVLSNGTIVYNALPIITTLK
jgi:hypothetical protein